PLTLNISRTCSLIRYPVYRCRLSRLIPASAVRCLPVRFSGFFRKAHRPEPSVAAWSSRPAARSSAARRRRSPSSFSPAPFTTWNASTLIRAWGAFARTTSWIHSAPSADTSVSILARSGPRSVKNFSTVAWQRPSPIQAIVPASWSVTTIRYWSSRLPQDFSSIPIRASPSSRSRPAAGSATCGYPTPQGQVSARSAGIATGSPHRAAPPRSRPSPAPGPYAATARYRSAPLQHGRYRKSRPTPILPPSGPPAVAFRHVQERHATGRTAARFGPTRHTRRQDPIPETTGEPRLVRRHLP